MLQPCSGQFSGPRRVAGAPLHCLALGLTVQSLGFRV